LGEEIEEKRWDLNARSIYQPEIKSNMKYFSYSPVDGMIVHNTEDEAVAHAKTIIMCMNEQAKEDGYNASINRVCCGEITHLACESAESYGSDFELDAPGFKLKPIESYDGE
jgi:hypothetical protein